MGRKDRKALAHSPPSPEPSSESDPEPLSEDAVSATSSDDDDDLVSSPSRDVTQPRYNTPLSPPSRKHLSTITTTGPAAAQHSDSDEEEPDELPKSPPSVVKPTPKPKPSTTSNHKPTVAALASSAKRPAQNDAVGASKSPEKKAKKEKPPSTPVAPPATSATVATSQQKQLIQRLWSEEDEMQILKGMIEYRKSRGVAPLAAPDDFFNFIKRSVHVADVKKDQMVNKVRRLKKRFINAQKRKSLTPKEQLAFDLGKKIWGPDLGMDNGSNGDEVEDGQEEDEPEPEPEKKKQEVVDDKKKDKKMATEEKKKVVVATDMGSVEGFGDELMELELGISDMNAGMLKGLMSRLEGVEKEVMRKMIKKANEASLEAHLLRMEVLKLAAKKLLDNIRST